jgi:hypothetical protein
MGLLKILCPSESNKVFRLNMSVAADLLIASNDRVV